MNFTATQPDGAGARLVNRPYRSLIAGKLADLTALSLMALPLTALSGCSTLPNSYEHRLADHLTETGAKMYGAYWCPHCANQKRAFNGAVERVPYVECDANGYNAQVETCAAEGIEAYPTWVIGGEQYLGSQPLGKLADLSGFESDDDDLPTTGETGAGGGYSPAE